MDDADSICRPVLTSTGAITVSAKSACVRCGLCTVAFRIEVLSDEPACTATITDATKTALAVWVKVVTNLGACPLGVRQLRRLTLSAAGCVTAVAIDAVTTCTGHIAAADVAVWLLGHTGVVGAVVR